METNMPITWIHAEDPALVGRTLVGRSEPIVAVKLSDTSGNFVWRDNDPAWELLPVTPDQNVAVYA